MADVTSALTAVLSTERGGSTLSTGLVTMVVRYLVDIVMVQDANQVSHKDLKEAIDEAWALAQPGVAMPGMLKRTVTAWLRGDSAPISSSRSMISMDGVDELADECDEQTLFGMEPSAKDLKALEDDKAAQGLNGTRLVGLSAAFELGRVAGNGEVLGVISYKSDARLSKLSKDQKKAGMRTLSKILESGKDAGVRRELQQHFGGLIREYTELRMIIEATLISQWWSETQTVSSEDSVLVAYILEWMRKYPGRGIPCTIDVVLATRVSGQRGGSGGGVSAEQLKPLKDAANSARSEIADLKRELKSLKAQMASMGREAGDGAGKADRLCHICGEPGHIAKFCPEKKKNKGKNKAKDDDDEADEA